jgi:hypothetical protein
MRINARVEPLVEIIKATPPGFTLCLKNDVREPEQKTRNDKIHVFAGCNNIWRLLARKGHNTTMSKNNTNTKNKVKVHPREKNTVEGEHPNKKRKRGETASTASDKPQTTLSEPALPLIDVF